MHRGGGLQTMRSRYLWFRTPREGWATHVSCYVLFLLTTLVVRVLQRDWTTRHLLTWPQLTQPHPTWSSHSSST